LTTAYFAPVQYFSKFLFSKIIIEKHENFSKQSYRNRCAIYGANGYQTLVVPVKKKHGQKTAITDVIIDYDTNWQKNHQRSIESAYRSAPFFEFYYDDILPFFQKEYKSLFELNLSITKTICKQLDIEPSIGFTKEFQKQPDEKMDNRYTIHPKKRMQKKDPFFKIKKYNQVFMEKHGFYPNLSILDMIFNEGPKAKTLLINSLITSW